MESIANAVLIPYLTNRPDIVMKEGLLHIAHVKRSHQPDVLDLQEFLDAMERENGKVTVSL